MRCSFRKVDYIESTFKLYTISTFLIHKSLTNFDIREMRFVNLCICQLIQT